MENIANSIIQASKERIRSPFFGAYFLSFIACNWKKTAILFWSKTSIEDRLSKVTDNTNIVEVFIFPFLTALLLIYFFQLLNYGLEYTLSKIKIGRKNLQLDMIKAELEKQKVNAVIEGEINDLKSNFKLSKSHEKLKKEIENNITIIDKLEKENEDLNAKIIQLKEINESNLKEHNTAIEFEKKLYKELERKNDKLENTESKLQDELFQYSIHIPTYLKLHKSPDFNSIIALLDSIKSNKTKLLSKSEYELLLSQKLITVRGDEYFLSNSGEFILKAFNRFQLKKTPS
ncbi:hypothetical protein [Tenacibaculum aiptasiae]|uniref:hypothetical protein n=1 Tax=Tenacibaculum aiptasiae TaxID=426481 RepID=UPI003B5B8F87